MGRPKKIQTAKQVEEIQITPIIVDGEAVIKAASSIVDDDIKPSGKTDVAMSGGTGADIEILRNKGTGNEVKMKGEYARKQVRRNPQVFEIVEPKKAK